MRRIDGSIIVTLAGGVEVLAQHFNQLYGRIPTFDSSVIDFLPRQTFFPNLDGLPTDDEITRNISRLHATSPRASGTHTRLWHALASTPAGFIYIRHFIIYI